MVLAAVRGLLSHKYLLDKWQSQLRLPQKLALLPLPRASSG
jgi:hypothetical protein